MALLRLGYISSSPESYQFAEELTVALSLDPEKISYGKEF